MNILAKNAFSSLSLFFLFQLLIPVALATSTTGKELEEKIKTIKVYDTGNTEIYLALHNMEETRGGKESYEILRNLLKNDKTINDVSMSKIQEAANIIENYNRYTPIKAFTNDFRYQQRPFYKAKLLLAEAVMDSRIDFSESSDTEVKYIEYLLQNYFYPGHPEKVTILYPSLKDFAFETWALTRKNILKSKIGLSGELVTAKDLKKEAKQQKMLGNGENEISESDMIALAKTAIELGLDFAMLKESYGNLKNRIINRDLYQSMLLQALAEPGSVQLDPQLQKFIQGVRVEIDLGETEGLDAKQREALEGALGEDIFSDGDDKTSINFTKLYGLKRKGTHSHLELQMGKKKSENDMVTLSVVSGIVGEDLSVMRVFQSIILTMQNGHEMASNPQIIKAVGIADEIFDVMAALAKKATSSKNEISSVGRLIQFSQNTGANIIRLPSFTYDWIASFSKSTYGKKMINAVQNFEFLQNGNFMAWLTLAAVTVETVTATVEYQYLNTKTEKRELIVETAARLFSFPIYFLPYVGQVAIGIDASHALFDTSWESADIYRQITKYAIKRKLRQYGFNETTLLLNGLEFEYDIPRNDIKFVLHGSNIKTLDEAMKRQVLLNKEISNTTKNNLVLLYRAHRELKRGANMDFGRKVHNYTDSYKSNIQTYLRVSKEILTAMETLPLNISKL